MTGAIKQIDATSVHRICSGQVVVDLATATKELLENSLDAGATSISIKFKNYGLDLIEVTDDGSGIAPEDYDSIGQKHHTSKLSTFENIEGLETFGFRGEALSSLCALSDVQITTATAADAPRATRLEFDHHGTIVSKKVASAKRGTTVSVSDLFSTLPVRRKEFSKNCKREFAKVITILQGYALVTTDVKISIFHQPPNGTLQLSTNGNKTIRENITNVFGARSLSSLEQLNLHLEIDVRHIGGQRTTENIEVVGYVSKAAHGEGRSSSDRQFFYVNSRPCLQPKIARTFNEIYRSYNSHQHPFILVDFRVTSGTFDLNLTPDKRTIFLHEEQAVIKELNDQLTQFYDSFQHTLPLRQFLTSSQPRRTERIKAESPESEQGIQPLSPEEPSSSDQDTEFPPSSATPRRQRPALIDVSSVERTISTVTGDFRERLATYALDATEEPRSLGASLTPVPEITISQSSPRLKTRDLVEEESSDDEILEEPRPQLAQVQTVKRSIRTVITPSQLEMYTAPSKRSRTVEVEGEGPRRSLFQRTLQDYLRKPDDSEVKGGQNDSEEMDILSAEQVADVLVAAESLDEIVDEDEDVVFADGEETASQDEDLNTSQMEEVADAVEEEGNQDREIHPNVIEEPEPISSKPGKSERNLFKSRQKNAVHNLQTASTVSLNDIRNQFHFLRHARTPTTQSGTVPGKEYAISNEKAEERLSLTVSKEDFSRMRIVGQFNLGFIIAVRDRLENGEHNDVEDVFIIDQHASDEKYNFERLQAETVMQVQTLARPQQLELTAMEESIVLDHLDVFKLNGFDIRPSLDESPGKRCYLHAIPMSGNTVFSLSDLEELIHLVQLHPDKKSVRCSKARAMFAMRACRSSIMIGKALSGKMMEKVVRNLGGLDKPWSCPHGRPTMRHLTELSGWTSWDEDMVDGQR